VRRSLAAVGLALVLVVAGCGGETGATSEPSPTTTAADFPSATWARADPDAVGLDRERLDRLQDYLADQRSDCMAVTEDGQLVRDVYWNGTDATTSHEVFSATKSITSMLVGIAQAQGDLDIGEPASKYLVEWRGTPSETLTIRDLLANASGRFWSLASDYNDLIRSPDKTAYAIGLSQQHPPGTDWEYNNSAIQTLDAVIKRATGTDTAEFARTRLFEPIGMASTMSHDAAGNTLTFMGLQASCLDLARFGNLLMQHGEWDGRQVIPAAYVDDATHISTELNAAYGYLVWLNQPGTVKLPVGGEVQGPIWPDAPADAYAALGLGGQTVLVIPDDGLVVTRIGPAKTDVGHQDQIAGEITKLLFGS
jgi:CubicO group peptidase (beta-lactamase class C family)